MLLSVLPHGWCLLGRCRFGTAGPVGPASGCHALAHPSIGMALLDVAPNATPNAEARLRRALGAADFWKGFPGTLPVWHGRIEIGAIRNLPGLMAEGFSTLPPLTVPGRDAWIAAARKGLAEDAAWEVPGQSPRQYIPPPPPQLDDDTDDDDVPVRAPAWRRGRLMAFGLAGGLALLLGLVWLGGSPSESEPAPAPVQVAAAPSPAAVPVAPQPAPRQQPVARIEPPLPPMERVVVAMPAPAPVVVPAAPVAAAPQPVEPAIVAPEPPAARLVEEVSLVLPPPAPPPAPPLRRVAAPRIDPGCTRALYRYQQGVTLTATEAAHVRNGCATRR